MEKSISSLFDHEDNVELQGDSTDLLPRISKNRGSSTKQNKPYIPVLLHKRADGITASKYELVSEQQPPYETSLETSHPRITKNDPVDKVIMKRVKYICYDCRRKFRDQEHLDRHKRLSLRHRNITFRTSN